VEVLDLDTASIEYRYRLINDAMSQQQFAHLGIIRISPFNVRHAPVGWNVFPGRGSFIMFGPFEGTNENPSGILPGAEDTLVIEASGFLPGVIQAQVMGNAPASVSTPEDLSPAQLGQLLALASKNDIDVRLIGPSIPGGFTEPELTLQIVSMRVAAD
jgi:hypothetical protein